MKYLKKFEAMDVDYLAAKHAIDELVEILSDQQHGEREEIADEIILFVEDIKKKYSRN